MARNCKPPFSHWVFMGNDVKLAAAKSRLQRKNRGYKTIASPMDGAGGQSLSLESTAKHNRA